ncbi:MAG: Crp/Fnr family transcriptional regulator [Candidatus Saccharibacteria bacterium]|nr:Crp/Fnr family transcriptional regulator [Candidatus Saccharibacteria bacterium]
MYDNIETTLHKLLLTGKSYKVPKGQVIGLFEDTSRINIIKSGYIERYLITKEGEKGIQVIYGPSNIFPLTPVYREIFAMNIYSGPEQYYYESMTELEIFSISISELKEAAEKDPTIYKDLFYEAGLRLNSYIHSLESQSLRVANKKISHQLMYLAEIFGNKSDDGVTIDLPLTHQNLADMLNLARETVTNCIVRLQEKNLIHDSSKHITIIDLEKLNQFSR